MIEDHNISYRQLKCMAILEGLGAGVFTIPALAVRESRSLGFWPMIVSGIFLLVYGIYIWWSAQRMENGVFPLWIRKIFLLRYWFNTFALFWFFCSSMQKIYMPKQSLLKIALPALVILWMVSHTSLQKRGRFMELIFPWTMVAFLGVILLSLWGSFSHWGTIPMLESPMTAIRNGYEVFLFCTPLEFLWLQIPAVVSNLWGEKREGMGDKFNDIEYDIEYKVKSGKKDNHSKDYIESKEDNYTNNKEDKSNTDRKTKEGCNVSNKKQKMSLLTIFLAIFLGNIALWFVTLQSLGAEGVVQTPWPVAKMMQLLQFPGGSVERCDLLLLIFWIFCVMAVMSGYLFYGAWIEHHETGYILLAFFGIFLLLGEKDIGSVLFWMKKYVDVPLLLLLSLIAVISPRINRQAVQNNSRKSVKMFFLFGIFLVCVPLFCTGCEKTSDIEEKNYVLSLYVDLNNMDNSSKKETYDEGEKATYNDNKESNAETFVYHVAVADLSAMEEKNKEIPCKVLTEYADSLSELEGKMSENISGDMEWNHVYTIFFSKQLENRPKKWKKFLREWDEGWQYAPDVNVVVTPATAEDIYGLKGITEASVGQEVSLFQEKQEFRNLFLTPIEILRALAEGEKKIYFPYVVIQNGRIKMW